MPTDQDTRSGQPRLCTRSTRRRSHPHDQRSNRCLRRLPALHVDWRRKDCPDRAAFYNSALVRYLDFNDAYLAKGETCHPSDSLGAILSASEYANGQTALDLIGSGQSGHQVLAVSTTKENRYAKDKDISQSLRLLDAQRAVVETPISGRDRNPGPCYTPMGKRYLQDILETVGAYVDVLKFAGGSFSLMPRDTLKELIDLCHEKVMFEAADPEVFAWYIKNYGPEVNLFVDHSQIVQLECLRSGIWGNKNLWGRVLTYKG